MRKEAAGLGLLVFSFSVVFIKLCFTPHNNSTSNTLDAAEIQAFNEYVDAVLNPDQNAAQRTNPPSLAGGLNDSQLGSLFNISNSKLLPNQLHAVAVWNHLKRLAVSSDLLWESTRQAILEAVTSWESLVKIISDQEDDPFLGEECSYSVQWSNSDGAKSRNAAVDIPCGLILDSSVTLIAVPHGSFGIRLLYLNASSASHSITILDYHVRLRESSVIIQSTGSSSSEEKCPSAVTRTARVDGLNSCFQKTQHSEQKSENMSMGFPFKFGLPFAATLRLGWHGFHMSVDGKHSTSYEYGKGHEPWMVNAVEVVGNVKVYSLMATGLPVAESANQMSHPEYLEAPPLSTKLTLLIGVFSTANNFDRRMALRRSWMQYQAVRSGRVTVRFFVGLDKLARVNSELWAEAMAYKDMQLLPFVEHYELITLKALAICIYGIKVAKSKFLMKADDDTFVRVDEVLGLIKDVNPNTALLLGLIEYSARPNRDKNSKWYITEEEWSHPYYPPWAHGPGYLISREIGKHVVESYEKSRLKLFKLEDVAMGIWISEYASKGRRVEYVNHDKFLNLECAPDYVIAHYQKPKDMLCLWKKLQTLGPICC